MLLGEAEEEGQERQGYEDEINTPGLTINIKSADEGCSCSRDSTYLGHEGGVVDRNNRSNDLCAVHGTSTNRGNFSQENDPANKI